MIESPAVVNENHTARQWWLAAAGVALLAFALLAGLALYRHDTFRSHALDLGYLDQVAWNTAHGAPFANTIKTNSWSSYFEGHFSPAIAVAVPLFWLWDDVRAMLLLQAALLVLAGLPIYALFRDYGEWLALAVLVAFCANPWLHRANLQDFHTMLLATPLISLAVYGVLRQRYTLAGLCLLATLPVKEDMGLVLALFGLYLLTFHRGRAWRWGVALLIAGPAWLVATTLLVIPSYASNGEYRILAHRYAFLGGGPAEAMQSLLHDPLILAKQVLRREKLLALVQLLASMGFLPLLGGGMFLVALPLIWYLQLSDDRALAVLEQWHVATYLPVLFGAIWVGFGRLPARGRTIAAGLLLLASLVAFVLDGSAIQILREPGMDPERRQVARSLMAQIPPEASVSAQDELLPHLSHRREIYLFPTIEDADYILMDRLGSTYPLKAEDYQVFWDAAQEPYQYSTLFSEHDFLLLKRQGP
jgi:uncharacterized membrane protein